jgi:hypothetical protein
MDTFFALPTGQTASLLKGRERIIDEAPYLCRCSDDKTAKYNKPREYAIRYPYMQVNRLDMKSWLVFDIDHSNVNVWDDEGLPPPNMIVRDRKKNTSHLFYAITPVCTSDKARTKPIQYMQAIYRAMALRLKSDVSYAGTVAKTPFHPWWSTSELHYQEYSLNELHDYLELETLPRWGQKSLEDVEHSRHCTLFEQVRFFAYSIVRREREESCYEQFRKRLELYAYGKNTFLEQGFDADLPESSIRSTVKSVARWTWDKYQGRSDCQRYIMQLDESLPLKERQSLAAKRTHTQRQEKTYRRLLFAAKRLQEQGERITNQSLAKAARLSRQTVAKYRDQVNTFLIAKTNIIPMGAIFRAKQRVNYAVHQIAAPFRGEDVVSNEMGVMVCTPDYDNSS